MKTAKKILLIFILSLVFAPRISLGPVFCETNRMAEYLCELGITFYKAGRYDEALIEFKKALMVDPGNKVARRYTDKIFKEIMPGQKAEVAVIKKEKPQKIPTAAKPAAAVTAPIEAAQEKKEIIVKVPPRAKISTIASLQQLISEAEKNIKSIDAKLQKREAKKPKAAAPKPTKEELRKAALERKEKKLELKRQQAMEKQLATAESKKYK